MTATRASTSGQPLDQFLAGTLQEYIACHGTSQYSVGATGQGLSACGIAAVNCARLIFDKERSGMNSKVLVKEMAKPAVAQEVLSLCAYWSSATHIDVEDIYMSPAFNRSLQLVSSEYGQPSVKLFTTLLSNLKKTSHSNRACSCAIITRPPEIIACFHIPSSSSEVDIFVIFDSHTRPDHPDGAAFIFQSSIASAAAYLSRLFPFDRSLVTDQSNQWQAQLLGNLSANIFVGKSYPADPNFWKDATLQASVAILNMRAEYLDLKAQLATLGEENYVLRQKLEEEKIKNRRLKAENLKPSRRENAPDSSRSREPAAPSDKGKGVVRTLLKQGSDMLASAWSSDVPMPGGLPKSPLTSTRSSSAPAAAITPSTSKRTDSEQPKKETQVHHPPPDEELDYAFALQQQQLFDEEDRRLSAERLRLASRAPRLFRCGICHDEYTEEYVAMVEECRHRYCRDCMKNYVSSKLSERRFPIVCPLCQVSTPSSVKKKSTLDGAIIQQLGLSEEESAIYIELEMSDFSLLVHCRHCQNSFFVDKRDLDETAIVSCPLPQCQHSWCRTCNQTLESAEAQHSCDGSTELRELMKSQGWKYCPGCQTPTEKIDGCNHLTCTGPGCNTHFCYLCSQPIVRSIDGAMVKAEVERHYLQCSLFNDVEMENVADD